MILTAVLVHRQKQIVAALQAAGAVDMAHARTPEELNVTPGMAWHQLVGHAVVRYPGEGRYFVDLARWDRLRAQRRRHAWMIGTTLVVLLGLLFWMKSAAA